MDVILQGYYNLLGILPLPPPLTSCHLLPRQPH